MRGERDKDLSRFHYGDLHLRSRRVAQVNSKGSDAKETGDRKPGTGNRRKPGTDGTFSAFKMENALACLDGRFAKTAASTVLVPILFGLP